MRRGVRPDDGGDPVSIVVEVVTGADPTLSADVVSRSGDGRGTTGRAALSAGLGSAGPPRAAHRSRCPGTCPSVLRLIDKLCDAGARTITHPACPRCLRVIHLHRPINGQWLCRSCTAKSRAQPCSRCGAVREAATRDEHGRAVVSPLFDRRSSQPRVVRSLWSSAPGGRPYQRRAAMHDLPTGEGADVLDLRSSTLSARVHGDRPAVVRGV